MEQELKMNPRKFASWLSARATGETIVYYQGVGIVDDHGIRNSIGNAAWKAGQDGLVTLSQKRLSSPSDGGLYGTFEYRATRR